jgi:hypothetical protein
MSNYLQQNRPVVVSGAMRNWKVMNWDPELLSQRFGSEQVQVYGNLFRLAAITTLSEYLNKHFGKESAPTSAPYVRWYCRLTNEERVPWADGIFDEFQDDWARPDFFPRQSFVFPHCSSFGEIDPSRNWFPARGLFISAKGARTRLHADPWCSDALLCQVYGRKDFVMYEPSQAPFLTNGTKTVDIESPDFNVFPDFSHAQVAVRDTLVPGEIVLVPAGWFHHFTTESDSISLTWNFVHSYRTREFVSYLLRAPVESELKQLTYYFESLGKPHPVSAEPLPRKPLSR